MFLSSYIFMPQLDIIMFLHMYLYTSIFFVFLYFCWTSIVEIVTASNNIFVFMWNVSKRLFFNFVFFFSLRIGMASKLFSFDFFVVLVLSYFGFQEPGNFAAGILFVYQMDLMYYLFVVIFIVLWLSIVALFLFADLRGYVELFKNLDLKQINALKESIDFHAKKSGASPKFAELFESCPLLEALWTIFPTVYLIGAGSSGVPLIFHIEDLVSRPDIILKAIGSQWLWTYEYSSYMDTSGKFIRFESTLIKDPTQFKRHFFTLGTSDDWYKDRSDLSEQNFVAMLEVDNRLVLPTGAKIKVLTTSSDVIHAWTIPALGVKMDAVPGRLNQINFTIQNEGIFRGQCSEFCGTGHGFMPIVLEACNYADFYEFIFKKSFESNLSTVDTLVLRQYCESFAVLFNQFENGSWEQLTNTEVSDETSLFAVSESYTKWAFYNRCKVVSYILSNKAYLHILMQPGKYGYSFTNIELRFLEIIANWHLTPNTRILEFVNPMLEKHSLLRFSMDIRVAFFETLVLKMLSMLLDAKIPTMQPDRDFSKFLLDCLYPNYSISFDDNGYIVGSNKSLDEVYRIVKEKNIIV